MGHWNEIRTAYHVARLGSISAAADKLKVHRTTVLRHVDALEALLGTKLFIRSVQGYVPTEAGKDLLRVAQVTEEQFTEMSRRARNPDDQLAGDFLVSSGESVSSILAPAIEMFQAKYPRIQVQYLSNHDMMKAEYDQAHIAIRSGYKPKELNHVVLSFTSFDIGLFAHTSYIKKYNKLNKLSDINRHLFIGTDNLTSHAPMYEWMKVNVPTNNIVFRGRTRLVQNQAITRGIGIGFLELYKAKYDKDLVQVLSDQQWVNNYWLVVHRDVYPSAKVQAFLSVLKSDEYCKAVNAILSV